LESFDIEIYKTHTEFILQTVAQIRKDFAMFGMQIEFTGTADLAYDEMFAQLTVHVSGLMDTNLGRLNALLYQVDVNENRIEEAQVQHPGWKYAEIISELIIYRELKKVLIRNYFKNNPDKL